MQTRGIKRDYTAKPQYFAVKASKESKRIRKPKAVHLELIESVRYAQNTIMCSIQVFSPAQSNVTLLSFLKQTQLF
jgi:hypothetical protein